MAFEEVVGGVEAKGSTVGPPNPHVLHLMSQPTMDQKYSGRGTSLVVQWLRIRLPMQGTQVRALVREAPTCRGATKPMRHNY